LYCKFEQYGNKSPAETYELLKKRKKEKKGENKKKRKKGKKKGFILSATGA